MDTDRYLQKVISNMRLMSQIIPEYIAGIKNKNSEHLYISPYFAKLLGRSHQEELGQVTFSPAYPLAKTIEDDQWVMRHQKNRQFILIENHNEKIMARTYIKYPLINPENKESIGVFYQATEYIQLNIGAEIIKGLLPYYDKRVEKLDLADKLEIAINYHLTVREKQVIFFFLANYNSLEIAKLLSVLNKSKVSKSTVDSIFREQLYVKFNVFNRQSLREKLIQLGYMQMIPKEIKLPLRCPAEACYFL